MMRPHRGCKGYDNCLVNYLCVLFFLFLGKAGSLVGMGAYEWQDESRWFSAPLPSTAKSEPIESH